MIAFFLCHALSTAAQYPTQGAIDHENHELWRKSVDKFYGPNPYPGRDTLEAWFPDFFKKEPEVDTSNGPRFNFSTKEADVSEIDTAAFAALIDYYNRGGLEGLVLEKNNPKFFVKDSISRNYYKLFRRIYGAVESFAFINAEQSTYNDSILIGTQAYYNVSFKKVSGRLSIAFQAIEKDSMRFVGLSFTPFDYSEVPFFASVSSITLEYLKTRNVDGLIHSSTNLYQQQITEPKKFSQALNALNYDSLAQFTSNLFLLNGVIVLRSIYDLPLAKKYMVFYYTEEERRYKLLDMRFIDKKEN